jgi:hypothetical protein
LVFRLEAPGDLDVGHQSTDRDAADKDVGVVCDADGRHRVSQRVADVQGASVGAQRQVARVRTIELGGAGRDGADLAEGWTGIDAERAHLVLEAVGQVEPRAGGVEHRLLGVEAGLELADHAVGHGVDHGGEVGVLIRFSTTR